MGIIILTFHFLEIKIYGKMLEKKPKIYKGEFPFSFFLLRPKGQNSFDLKVKVPQWVLTAYCNRPGSLKTVDSTKSEPKAKKTKTSMEEPKPWKHLLPRALTNGLWSQFSKLTPPVLPASACLLIGMNYCPRISVPFWSGPWLAPTCLLEMMWSLPPAAALPTRPTICLTYQ